MDENPNPTVQNRRSSGPFVSGLLFIWDFLKVVIIALVIILPIRYFIFQPFLVSGSSMVPNFQDGQYLIIDELSYRFQTPQRGDVLVLRPPINQNEYYIKRIIGLPGEKIQIEDDHIIIYNNEHPNGFTLTENYLPTGTITVPHNSQIVGNSKIITLSSDQYFMMGDNRAYSSDSRDWGPITKSEIVGKVYLRVLPVSDFHLFSTPAYLAT